MSRRILLILTIGILITSIAIFYLFEGNNIVNSVKANQSKKVDVFLEGVYLDVANSFGVSLVNLKKVNEKELIIDRNNDYAKSLLEVRSEIVESEGDLMPGIYIDTNSDKGYIFQKKSDGTNYTFFLNYDGKWKITKTENKSGRQMRFNDK